MGTIKFGVQFKPEFNDFQTVVEAFQSARDLGFTSAWLYDHLYSMAGKPPLEGWTTLAALSAVIDDIRLGMLVSCNSFRYPQLLVKMASTVDLISKGRLEFGIGAGWYRREYKAYGIPYPTLDTRIEQLEEALQITKKMWTHNKASFNGKYYTIDDLELQPTPLQKPHPPIWIGGNPSKILTLVAKFGDASNLVNLSPQESKEKHKLLHTECDKLGRKHYNLIHSWHGSLFLSDNENKIKDMAQRRKVTSRIKRIRSLSTEKFLKKTIYGTSDQCINCIQRFNDVGITYFILAEPATVRPELTRFAQEIMPSFI